MEVVISSRSYEMILDVIESWNDNSKSLTELIVTKFGVPYRTAGSIVSINFVRRMKESHFKVLRQAEELWNNYLEAVLKNEESGIILRMATRFRSSPALIAKILLEQYLRSRKIDPEEKETEIQLTDKKDIVKPTDSPRYRAKIPGEGRNTASRMIRDTSLINDGRLASEILLCDLYDEHYGPITEIFNRGVGDEFEQLLRDKAKEASLVFQSEEELRSRGFDKTPDLKLSVPIAVDGFVVNWIESKGLFGDEAGHRGYIADQYSSYWNRFGPGLVIYWLGYEDSILRMQPNEKKFIVRAGFPTNITHMEPTSVIFESLHPVLHSSS